MSFLIVMIAFQAILVILLMVFVGYLFSSKGVINKRTGISLATVHTYVLAPCLFFLNIHLYITPQVVQDLLLPIATAALSAVLGFFLGDLITRIVKLPQKRRGNFRTMVAISNSMFMGMPVCLAMFGEIAMGPIVVYFLCNSIVFWSFGYYMVLQDTDQPVKIFSATALKRMLSPGIIAAIIGFIVVYTGLNLPAFMSKTISVMGRVAGMMGTLLGGIILFRMELFKKGNMRYQKGLLPFIVGRYLVIPMMTLFLCWVFGLNRLTRDVFVIMSAMPPAIQPISISEQFGADANFATLLFASATILGIAVVPFYAFLLSVI